MLTTNQLHIDGRRHTLLPATTLEAHRGELLLVQADGQERRTALSLALTGRMKSSTGTVVLGHDDSLAGLRRRSAVVDAPEVNAPEHHLTVRSLASEDLALVPFRFRDRTRPTEWLRRNGFEDILPQWIEEVDSGRLLHLQLALALANKDIELIVVDSPDRHTSDDGVWLSLLTRLAEGELVHGDTGSAPRQLMVVAVVARFPADWDGPAVTVGDAAPPAETSSDNAAPPAEPGSDNTAPITIPDVDVAEPAPAAGADEDAEEVPGVVREEMPEQGADVDEEDTTNEAGESK